RTATVPQFLARLYELPSVREHFLRRGDRQAAENLEKLREVARHLFRNEHALTLRAFVSALKRNLPSGAEESEALLAPGEEAERPPSVRRLTIHGARGWNSRSSSSPRCRPRGSTRTSPRSSFLVTTGSISISATSA